MQVVVWFHTVYRWVIWVWYSSRSTRWNISWGWGCKCGCHWYISPTTTTTPCSLDPGYYGNMPNNFWPWLIWSTWLGERDREDRSPWLIFHKTDNMNTIKMHVRVYLGWVWVSEINRSILYARTHHLVPKMLICDIPS